VLGSRRYHDCARALSGVIVNDARNSKAVPVLEAVANQGLAGREARFGDDVGAGRSASLQRRIM
jgi:hypothetical protein